MNNPNNSNRVVINLDGGLDDLDDDDITLPSLPAQTVPIIDEPANVASGNAVAGVADIALGTSIAFLMSVSAMSLPEAVILRGAMKMKLLSAFFLTVFLGIVALGYFINFVSPYILGH